MFTEGLLPVILSVSHNAGADYKALGGNGIGDIKLGELLEQYKKKIRK